MLMFCIVCFVERLLCGVLMFVYFVIWVVCFWSCNVIAAIVSYFGVLVVWDLIWLFEFVVVGYFVFVVD